MEYNGNDRHLTRKFVERHRRGRVCRDERVCRLLSANGIKNDINNILLYV